MRKPRILLVNEASFLATGYSNYGMEVQKRLYATGKYDMAELACYAYAGDGRAHGLPWIFYSNMHQQHDEKEKAVYNLDVHNQFGKFKFNEVVLDFKPDIVWDIRDHWMLSYGEQSPFRRFYNWVIMPTVDAMPQHEQWISTYIDADAVFTYSDWGREVLDREGGGMIRTVGSAPPGADLDTFRPMDKTAVRNKFQCDPDAFIVGTVMRNQPRKLYPNLIEGFKIFLGKADRKLAGRSFLYLHTSYPDQGWDIPKLIKQSGIGHKILVTYKCHSCMCVFASFYHDARACCPKCKQRDAGMPNVQHGVDRGTLAMINNLFDVYVQYSNSEGFGMPQVEAASCGVPVVAPDYSAMSDVVKKVGGFPLKKLTYREEDHLGCLRCIPDDNELADILLKFANMSESTKAEYRLRARKGVERHYTWDQTTTRWMTVFDNLPLRNWDAPQHIIPRVQVPRTFPSTETMVRWCIANIIQRPDLAKGYMAMRMIRDLNLGVTQDGGGATYHNENAMLGSKNNLKAFSESEMLDELYKIRDEYNGWEERRCKD